jgi:hypothetical protein
MKAERTMKQPDLIPPDPTTSTLTVAGADLERTERHLREIGAVLLGFSVRGSTYTLNVIMPPGEMIEQILEGRR